MSGAHETLGGVSASGLSRGCKTCDKRPVRATGEIRWDTIGEREPYLPLAWAPAV